MLAVEREPWALPWPEHSAEQYHPFCITDSQCLHQYRRVGWRSQGFRGYWPSSSEGHLAQHRDWPSESGGPGPSLPLLILAGHFPLGALAPQC